MTNVSKKGRKKNKHSPFAAPLFPAQHHRLTLSIIFSPHVLELLLPQGCIQRRSVTKRVLSRVFPHLEKIAVSLTDEVL